MGYPPYLVLLETSSYACYENELGNGELRRVQLGLLIPLLMPLGWYCCRV